MFSLYPHGYGSAELLSGNAIEWDGGMTEYRQCDKRARRDQCSGVGCEMAAPRDQEGYD